MSRFVYILVLCVTGTMAILPLGWALGLGRGLGNFAYYVLRIRRAVVVNNLRHVLGDERSEAEIQTIAPEVYRQFAMTLVEVLRSSAPFGDGLAKNVTFDDLAPLAALRDAKRAAICVEPHAGNFDLVAYAFASQGFPLSVVMRAIKNKLVNGLIKGVREKHGVTVLESVPATPRRIRALLARGEWVGMLPDQNAKEHGALVLFLGKPASLYKGAATFHLETGAPLIVAVSVRSSADPRLHHVGYEILPVYARTSDPEADTTAVMQLVADAFSKRILLHPEQYFFMHRLWGKQMHVEAAALAKARVAA